MRASQSYRCLPSPDSPSPEAEKSYEYREGRGNWGDRGGHGTDGTHCDIVSSTAPDARVGGKAGHELTSSATRCRVVQTENCYQPALSRLLNRCRVLGSQVLSIVREAEIVEDGVGPRRDVGEARLRARLI